MDQFHSDLHPVYGAIPLDGEYVERGEVLGLTLDMQVVTAPVSGWVRLVSSGTHTERQLRIEIVSQPAVSEPPPSAPA